MPELPPSAPAAEASAASCSPIAAKICAVCCPSTGGGAATGSGSPSSQRGERTCGIPSIAVIIRSRTTRSANTSAIEFTGATGTSAATSRSSQCAFVPFAIRA
jgi:hypothetical protein